MERRFYAVWYRLDGKDAYILWYTNAQDGVVLDDSGRLPTFQSVSNLKLWAEGLEAAVNTETMRLHNLDTVAEWITQPAKETIDCEAFLAAWNLFDDVRKTVEKESFAAQRNTLYEKLFYANNLPSVRREGAEYVPEWSDRELEALQSILHRGLELFRSLLVSA